MASNIVQPGSGLLVSARYTNNAGQAIPSGAATIFNFVDQDYDDHNAVTTGAAWKFTAPFDGVYALDSLITFSNQSYTAGASIILAIYKNGVEIVNSYGIVEVTTSNLFGKQASSEIDMVKGDYLDVRISQGSGGTRTTQTGGQYNFISISLVR